SPDDEWRLAASGAALVDVVPEEERGSAERRWSGSSITRGDGEDRPSPAVPRPGAVPAAPAEPGSGGGVRRSTPVSSDPVQPIASSFFLSWALGTAPITWSTTAPPFMNRIVGIERTP